MSESELRKIVENWITFDRCFVSSFYFHVCKCTVGELCKTFKHIRESSHVLALNKFMAQHELEANETSSDNNNATQVSKDNSQALRFEFQLKSNSVTYSELIVTFNCNTYKTNIISHPNITEHRQELLHQTLESNFASVSSDQIQEFHHKTILENNKNKLEMREIETASQELVNQIIIMAESTLQIKKVESCNETVLQGKSVEFCFSEIYCCDICQAFLRDNADAQCHVTLHLFKEFNLMNNFDILEFKFGADRNVYLKCLLCGFYCLSKMSDAHEFLREHFKTEVHLKRLIFFKINKNELELGAKNEQINGIDLKKFTYNIAHSICPCLLCNICDIPVPFSKKNFDIHTLGKCHEKKLQEIENGAVVEVKGGYDAKNDHYYKCFICTMSFRNPFILFDHYKTPEHKWKIEAFKIIKKCSYTHFKRSSDMQIINCSLCNIFFNDFKATVEHILGKDHNEKLNLLVSEKNKMNTETISLVQSSENVNSSVNPEKLTKKQKKQANAANNVSEELNPLNPYMTDEVLDDLVSLDFNKSQTKKLPSRAKTKSPCTPKVKDLLSRFARNVLLNGKTLIKYCICPGPENIFNFDDERITLMKLGTTLTFPHCSDRVCIPCRQQFLNDLQSLFEHLQNKEHLNNICNMLVYDKAFEDAPQQFSDLKLAKLYMHVLDQSVQCHACDIEIEDDDNIIRKHVKGFIHKEKSKLWKEESDQLFNQCLTICKDIWYYAEVFFCEICKTRCEFEIDFATHLLDPEHMKKVYQLKYNGTTLTFDSCPPCTTYWFGKADFYGVHCQSDFHKRFAKKKDFMVPNLTIDALEFLDNIEENVNLLVSESDKVDLEIDKETALLMAIVETVKPTYPNAEAYVFGSRLSHLGFSNSDVDVFLDCESVYYKSSTKEQNQKYIKTIKRYFECIPNTWKMDELLLQARVPIMRLRHIPTNLHCDISFVNGLSVEKSRLVGIYNCAFPICRKLILFMKKWLTLCRIFGPDYITTFAISWCVIFYLQLQGILPSVHELVKSKMESKIVDGWECGFEAIFTEQRSELSFKEHLKGFFTYFANFDYQKSVVCPYLGKTIAKHAFAYTDELPPEMDIYNIRLKDNEMEIFCFDSPMCIQDPIDLSQNLTKAVKKQQLRCFRQYCVLSAERC